MKTFKKRTSRKSLQNKNRKQRVFSKKKQSRSRLRSKLESDLEPEVLNALSTKTVYDIDEWNKRGTESCPRL